MKLSIYFLCHVSIMNNMLIYISLIRSYFYDILFGKEYMKKILLGLLVCSSMNSFASVGDLGDAKYRTITFHSKNNEVMVKYKALKNITDDTAKNYVGYISELELCNGSECKDFKYGLDKVPVYAYGINWASFVGQSGHVQFDGQFCASYITYCSHSIHLKLDNAPEFFPMVDSYDLVQDDTQSNKISFKK